MSNNNEMNIGDIQNDLKNLKSFCTIAVNYDEIKFEGSNIELIRPDVTLRLPFSSPEVVDIIKQCYEEPEGMAEVRRLGFEMSLILADAEQV